MLSTDVVELQEEVLRLRQRVDDLESTVGEYRLQLSKVLASASWRLTSPLRVVTARSRSLRVRVRRSIAGGRTSGPRPRTSLVVTGLVSPPGSQLPEGSALRLALDVNALTFPGVSRPSAPRPPVLVVAHVHYPELWGDIEDRLVRIPVAYDLAVTVTAGNAEAVIPSIRRRHPTAQVVVCENRGRDWGPFVELVNTGACAGYEAIAKVHTKKSEHRIDGDGWRLALLDGIFESPEQVGRIVDLLREDRSVGLVVPTGFVEGTEHWGSNLSLIEALAARLPMAFDPEALRFPGGSMFWCRPWVLERIADLCLTSEDFEHEAGQYDGTTAHALERVVGVFCAEAGLDVVEAMDVRNRLAAARRSAASSPTVLAFYLPQYHQTPENDAFWGEGFTDWVNVTKARPLFDGHRQPILPAAEVGFYDLADPDVLRQQAALARAYGVGGFVFHHYWFDGRTVLDTPLRNWLADPSIDMPLALCWANEAWTRRWDGLNDDVLIPQTYSPGWVERFWENVRVPMHDDRYVRVAGRPLLVIYRMDLLPDPTAAVTRWRELARADGLGGLHVVGVQAMRNFGRIDAQDFAGVDAVLEFPPLSGVELRELPAGVLVESDASPGHVLSYRDARPGGRSVGSVPAGIPVLRGVMPGWDNTARRGEDAYLFHGANPVTFAGHLRRSMAQFTGRGPHLLFVNAWNEWAEGAALEPSRRFGHSYLQAIADVLPDPT